MWKTETTRSRNFISNDPLLLGHTGSWRSGSGKCVWEGEQDSRVLPGELWSELLQLRQSAGEDEPVFPRRNRSHGGHHLHRYSVDSLVKAAAKRAGIKGNVSPTGCATPMLVMP